MNNNNIESNEKEKNKKIQAARVKIWNEIPASSLRLTDKTDILNGKKCDHKRTIDDHQKK